MTLSIIIPTYNRKLVLPRAVKSVRNQAFRKWELVIVDDGSTDSTSELLKQWQREDNRIKGYSLSQHRGMFAARNRGVKQATGDWVCFLDSDDYYLPGALATMNHEITKADDKVDIFQFSLKALISVGKYQRIGYKPREPWHFHYPTYEEVVLKQDISHDMHRCIRTSLAKAHPYPHPQNSLETAYYAALAGQGFRIKYVNKTVGIIDLISPDRHSQQQKQQAAAAHAQALIEFITQYKAIFKKHHRLREKELLVAKLFLTSKQYLQALYWFAIALTDRYS